MSAARTVACPRCGAAVEWSPQARFRPFCSERCKMNDLGAWAMEKYKVKAHENEDDDSERPDEPTSG
jgi:endogenous inhibitor of DNA gyrase (YacG/DUF329 family)